MRLAARKLSGQPPRSNAGLKGRSPGLSAPYSELKLSIADSSTEYLAKSGKEEQALVGSIVLLWGLTEGMSELP